MTELRTQQLVLPRALSSIAAVVLNVLGAHWFGVPGVALAAVAFGMLYCGWIFALEHRRPVLGFVRAQVGV
jgi:hypothetical protein